MKFRKERTEKYYCIITDYLDKIVGFHSVFGSHYILVDEHGIENQRLAIRVPGHSVGELFINEESRIEEINITIQNGCIMYPKNLNEELKQYVGEKVEI